MTSAIMLQPGCSDVWSMAEINIIWATIRHRQMFMTTIFDGVRISCRRKIKWSVESRTKNSSLEEQEYQERDAEEEN